MVPNTDISRTIQMALYMDNHPSGPSFTGLSVIERFMLSREVATRA
jgi:hypothetical protein